MQIQEGLAFDDVLLVPQSSEVLPDQVCVSTQLTRQLSLSLPLLSAAMDTVTGDQLAIAMGQLGGAGVLHKNMSAEDQAQQVKTVKAANQIAVAAVGAGEAGIARARRLVDAGVDAVVVDTAHGHSRGVLETVKQLRAQYSEETLQIIGGNIATPEAVLALVEAGADAVKVGVGPGSICTTRVVAGVGVPQLSAILACAKEAKKLGVPVIADGGVKSSGDCAKALAAGASTVMMGGVFAGTDESIGEIIEIDGQKFKTYRGMGSMGAMEAGSSDRYFQAGQESKKLVPEGIEGCVPVKGPVADVVHQLIGGVKASMGYLGAADLRQFYNNASWVKMSSAGLKESRVHDVTMTKRAPNYSE